MPCALHGACTWLCSRCFEHVHGVKAESWALKRFGRSWKNNYIVTSAISLRTSSPKLPPGPEGRFLVGNAVELARDWMGFLSHCARQYGDAVFFRFFGVPICLLTHPEYIEHLLVTNRSNFVKPRDCRVHARVMGEGLLTAEGDVWHR
jgi:Cytochrome P450